MLFGANGVGKTTPGRELSRLLNFRLLDAQDYSFEPSAIPCEKPREKSEVIRRMRADIARHGSFAVCGVTGDLREREQAFLEVARTRDPAKIEAWAAGLKCPVLRLDATDSAENNLRAIARAYGRLTGAD